MSILLFTYSENRAIPGIKTRGEKFTQHKVFDVNARVLEWINYDYSYIRRTKVCKYFSIYSPNNFAEAKALFYIIDIFLYMYQSKYLELISITKDK